MDNFEMYEIEVVIKIALSTFNFFNVWGGLSGVHCQQTL